MCHVGGSSKLRAKTLHNQTKAFMIHCLRSNFRRKNKDILSAMHPDQSNELVQKINIKSNFDPFSRYSFNTHVWGTNAGQATLQRRFFELFQVFASECAHTFHRNDQWREKHNSVALRSVTDSERFASCARVFRERLVAAKESSATQLSSTGDPTTAAAAFTPQELDHLLPFFSFRSMVFLDKPLSLALEHPSHLIDHLPTPEDKFENFFDFVELVGREQHFGSQKRLQHAKLVDATFLEDGDLSPLNVVYDSSAFPFSMQKQIQFRNFFLYGYCFQEPLNSASRRHQSSLVPNSFEGMIHRTVPACPLSSATSVVWNFAQSSTLFHDGNVIAKKKVPKDWSRIASLRSGAEMERIRQQLAAEYILRRKLQRLFLSSTPVRLLFCDTRSISVQKSGTLEFSATTPGTHRDLLANASGSKSVFGNAAAVCGVRLLGLYLLNHQEKASHTGSSRGTQVSPDVVGNQYKKLTKLQRAAFWFIFPRQNYFKWTRGSFQVRHHRTDHQSTASEMTIKKRKQAGTLPQQIAEDSSGAHDASSDGNYFHAKEAFFDYRREQEGFNTGVDIELREVRRGKVARQLQHRFYFVGPRLVDYRTGKPRANSLEYRDFQKRFRARICNEWNAMSDAEQSSWAKKGRRKRWEVSDSGAPQLPPPQTSCEEASEEGQSMVGEGAVHQQAEAQDATTHDEERERDQLKVVFPLFPE